LFFFENKAPKPHSELFLLHQATGLVYFFDICFGMVQHQKQLGCREGRKIR